MLLQCSRPTSTVYSRLHCIESSGFHLEHAISPVLGHYTKIMQRTAQNHHLPTVQRKAVVFSDQTSTAAPEPPPRHEPRHQQDQSHAERRAPPPVTSVKAGQHATHRVLSHKQCLNNSQYIHYASDMCGLPVV